MPTYLGKELDAQRIVIQHHFAQNDIAAMAALARESVNRTMTEWRKTGVVDLLTRTTMVVHKVKLEQELRSAGGARRTVDWPIAKDNYALRRRPAFADLHDDKVTKVMG